MEIEILVGVVSTFLIAVAQQAGWSSTVRRWVALGVSLGLGLVVAYINGDFGLTGDLPSAIVSTVATVVATSQIAYAALKRSVIEPLDVATTRNRVKSTQGSNDARYESIDGDYERLFGEERG